MKPTVAIIGLGLIGGSLGQALRRSGRYSVIGIDNKREVLHRAKILGAVDKAFSQLDAVRMADIIVIATPVAAIVPVFKKIVKYLQPGAIVTDVGSVKGPIMRGVSKAKLPKGSRFIGGHPSTGSHRSGVEASNFRLFDRSPVILTPAAKSNLGPLKALWGAAGARPTIMSAKEHDEAVALISHLPHVLAHAMVHAVISNPQRRRLKSLLAGSFRDATRVASSDPDQWAQILSGNAKAVRQALAAFRRELTRLEKLLSQANLRLHLKKSRVFRNPLFKVTK